MTNKTKMYHCGSGHNEWYVGENGSTLKREYGETTAGTPFSGRWVYRNRSGDYLGHSQWRNDLAGRHNFELVGG